MGTPDPHAVRVAYFSDPRLAQDALLEHIQQSTLGKAPDHLTDAVARWFVAHVNDAMPADMAWVPQYSVLIGPKGWAAPSADEFVARVEREWTRFLSYMPGSNR